MTKKTSDGMNILIGFLLVMASLTAAVGSIGLTGTMSLNVLERTREIGITRAIGASNRTVMNLVIVEGVLIGMMSWLFGALLSFPISTIMSNAINLSLFGAPAAFTFTPTGVILVAGPGPAAVRPGQRHAGAQCRPPDHPRSLGWLMNKQQQTLIY